MAPDKFKAVWVSHSSMGDFIRCPRAYYLHNVYKDPKTNRKISIVNGALSLGVAVHNTLEALKEIPTDERMKRDLHGDLEKEWAKVAGKKGGFKDEVEEREARDRATAMIDRVIAAPGPLTRKTVRLKDGQNGMAPNFYLSEEDNIILNGRIDWLEYIEADDSLRVIDFKTGKNEESADSLQLPIYLLLLNALQKRKVSSAAYWYLEKDEGQEGAWVEKELPPAEEAKEKVLTVARTVKKAREDRVFECHSGAEGCYVCRPYEKILRGEAEYLGVGGFGQDTYFIA
jgi:ATP-dependent helicase/DNAse subunit B